MKRLFLIVFLSLLAAPSILNAAESPLLYTRTTLLFSPSHSNPHGKIAFNAEVRSVDSTLNTPGWYNLSTLKDYHAAMLVYPEENFITVYDTQDYAPTDLLFVNIYGEIVQILPELVPAQLEEPIVSDTPIIAIIYLKPGSVTELNMRLGDHFQHNIFQKKTVIMTEGEQPAIETIRTDELAADTSPSPITPDKDRLLTDNPNMISPEAGTVTEKKADEAVEKKQERLLLMEQLLKRHGQQ